MNTKECINIIIKVWWTKMVLKKYNPSNRWSKNKIIKNNIINNKNIIIEYKIWIITKITIKSIQLIQIKKINFRK